MDAFDADVLIYAAAATPLGQPVLALLDAAARASEAGIAGIGSVLLVPEVLSKPLRDEAQTELQALGALLGRLDLRPVDPATAQLAAAVGANYRLKAADSVHLATAVLAGADRFITNNRRDFTQSIGEIDVVYPDDLLGAG